MPRTLVKPWTPKHRPPADWPTIADYRRARAERLAREAAELAEIEKNARPAGTDR